MGYYVHFQVSWSNGSVEELKPLAKKHLDLIEPDERDQEVGWFFKDIMSGKSFFDGRKGTFWAWGTIGNYLVAEDFIEAVKPFFADCYLAGFIFDFERVIFMREPEQSESVEIFQLDNTGKVTEFSSEGKWFWGQM